MPPVSVSQADLARFGQRWAAQGQRLSRTPPESSGQLGFLLDEAVAKALAAMLGDIPIVTPNGRALIPSQPDCVELGPVLIIGGVRPQTFDVGYRPDSVRFVFDSKTLNDTDSIRKNWQNMVNDLASEATTVHSRFPHAVVAFIVALPAPCVMVAQQNAMVETLERLTLRTRVDDAPYRAEAIALAVWNPEDGTFHCQIPALTSPLRMENFSEQVADVYYNRYKGLPPHAL